jgi:hypothetical protein
MRRLASELKSLYFKKQVHFDSNFKKGKMLSALKI